MSYDHEISQIVNVVEGVGAGIMIIGAMGAFGRCAYQALHGETVRQSYETLRRNLVVASCSVSKS